MLWRLSDRPNDNDNNDDNDDKVVTEIKLATSAYCRVMLDDVSYFSRTNKCFKKPSFRPLVSSTVY